MGGGKTGQSETPENDLIKTLRSALTKQEKDESLQQILVRYHPLDIAAAFKEFHTAEILRIFSLMDDQRAMEVLDRADAKTARILAEKAPLPRIVLFLKELPNRKTARTLARNTPATARALLEKLEIDDPQDMQELRRLLSYPENTAGRMTTQHFVQLYPAMTLEEAFNTLRESDPTAETASDLFVTEPMNSEKDKGVQLVGVVSLREMMRARFKVRTLPHLQVRDFMSPASVTVKVDTPQHEVAMLIGKYHFLSLPVIEQDGSLAGVIQIDDVIDLLDEEQISGDAAEVERSSPFHLARLRVPWLLGTMGIELCAGLVIHHFDDVLKRIILLASFMPVISAISGNVGLQSAAIVVRGLGTGHVTLSAWTRQLAKELLTTALMAIVCGVVLGGIGVFWSRHVFFGIVIGGAMAASMLTAACMGTLIPILSKKLGFDPATTAGPFETAFQDIVGFGVFLWLASHWLQ